MGLYPNDLVSQDKDQNLLRGTIKGVVDKTKREGGCRTFPRETRCRNGCDVLNAKTRGTKGTVPVSTALTSDVERDSKGKSTTYN